MAALAVAGEVVLGLVAGATGEQVAAALAAGIALALAATFGAIAGAQTVDVSFSRPSMDSWMYPFNFSRGAETYAATFGAILQPGFDDRDAQFLLGFVTGGNNPLVEPGHGLNGYKLLSARLTVVAVGDKAKVLPQLQALGRGAVELRNADGEVVKP